MKNKIIAAVGMAGSGKSIVGDILKEKGWGFVRFGQITLDGVMSRGLEINEPNERKVREELRAEHGMAVMAKLMIPKIDELLKKGNVIADGLYSWDEYKLLKETYGDQLTVVAIYASPAVRYDRLEKRVPKPGDTKARDRQYTKEMAQKRDYAEIEVSEKAGPIAMADYNINNTGTLEDLRKNVLDILAEIESK